MGTSPSEEFDMKTKQEKIKEEIIELYSAHKAYSEVMEITHKLQLDAMKKMMDLNHMLEKMDKGEQP
jgi:hypothetical protein